MIYHALDKPSSAELRRIAIAVTRAVEDEVSGAVMSAFDEHVRRAKEDEERVRDKTFQDAIEVARKHECRGKTCVCGREIAISLQLARLGG